MARDNGGEGRKEGGGAAKGHITNGLVFFEIMSKPCCGTGVTKYPIGSVPYDRAVGSAGDDLDVHMEAFHNPLGRLFVESLAAGRVHRHEAYGNTAGMFAYHLGQRGVSDGLTRDHIAGGRTPGMSNITFLERGALDPDRAAIERAMHLEAADYDGIWPIERAAHLREVIEAGKGSGLSEEALAAAADAWSAKGVSGTARMRGAHRGGGTCAGAAGSMARSVAQVYGTEPTLARGALEARKAFRAKLQAERAAKHGRKIGTPARDTGLTVYRDTGGVTFNADGEWAPY